MLRSIQLDHESRFYAGEIGKVRLDCKLAPEFASAQLAVAQSAPKDALNLSPITPQ